MNYKKKKINFNNNKLNLKMIKKWFLFKKGIK